MKAYHHFSGPITGSATRSVAKTKNAKPTAATAMYICANMTNIRRSTRSANTPAHGPMLKMGRVRMPTTAPVKNALPLVICNTSQPTVRIRTHWAPTVKK